MQTGRIVSINVQGVAQVQLSEGVIEAQILSGGANIGDRVNGPMEEGIQTWLCACNRTIVVSVYGTHMGPARLTLRAA